MLIYLISFELLSVGYFVGLYWNLDGVINW